MLKVGLVLAARREITWFGMEIPEEEKEALLKNFRSEAAIEILDICPDLIAGFQIRNPDRPADDLRIGYYLPDEEGPEAAETKSREVDLSLATVVRRRLPRRKCEPGHVYLCGGEYRPDVREIRHYDTGFQPPFRPEDVMISLDDLSDYGYDGLVATNVWYSRQDPVYSETDFRPGRRIDSRLLED